MDSTALVILISDAEATPRKGQGRQFSRPKFYFTRQSRRTILTGCGALDRAITMITAMKKTGKHCSIGTMLLRNRGGGARGIRPECALLRSVLGDIGLSYHPSPQRVLKTQIRLSFPWPTSYGGASEPQGPTYTSSPLESGIPERPS